MNDRQPNSQSGKKLCGAEGVGGGAMWDSIDIVAVLFII